jgi:DNA-binding CsgD family transcriptional regulator
MQRLSTSDLESALRFVQEAAAETGPEPFPEHVLDRLRALIGSEWITFCELDRVHQRVIGGIEVPVPPELPDEDDTFWRVVGDHPLCEAQKRGRFDALKLSDFHSRRELHRTEIYADWFRPAAVEYEMEVAIPSPPEHTKTFLFDDQTHDFTERERALANLLQPHLVQLYRAAAVRRVADRARIIAIDPHGALEPASAEARRLFDAYDVQAAIVADWLSVRGTGPLTVGGADGMLVIDIDRRTDGDVLVLTERPGPAPAELTPREHEVLELVRDGLQNAEIAERLWVSPATVRKHLENIYEKLGVHTRTAAVARVHGPR